MFTERTPRVASARALTRRAGRDKAGRFLVEGAQAVREALAFGRVHELFVTEAAAERNPSLVDVDVPVSFVTDKAASGLSETITPQGIIAVCDLVDRPLTELAGPLVAVMVGVSDPGNAGTVTRVADAAGAGSVVFAGATVDPHNGKCVRASTGSVFHLPVIRARSLDEVFAACRSAGLRLVAADGHATHDLDQATDAGELTAPTAWVFGSEAHGLDDAVLAEMDSVVKVPLYGAAESLNLATAAAVCLYASARALRAG
ncbi:FIG011178: rRNA methylase [Alloactinosynnema sp. L-07]|uniref:TrmH family RNA methyltransferase n=1 Tax=Alloactinosynnema sp. L-07 TaxID=1653480 RepID=UPI00065EF293|nr:RNA methyltransferase [Alloactinosynnema sp. L-07]CRK56279.1 FIG011178: rRNA methylase [Alloactinosynnema sp. L-07]